MLSPIMQEEVLPMKKLKSRLGMTMAELLIVVAIIAVLGGLSFVAVWNYQRSLGQLERDGIAKEIFVAAQNHLTAAYGEGYLGLKISPDENPFGETAADGTSYLVVNSEYLAAHGNTIPDGSILGMMLPFGSIDETVRLGGSYLIHYQAKTGLMLDVFYCTRSGSPKQFNHELGSIADEYEIVMGLRGESNKSARRTYEQGGRSILGWYGGDGAASLPQVTLAPPTMVIKNEEKLYVEVTNPNPGPDGTPVSVNPILKLLVTGADSGAQKAYELNLSNVKDRVKWNNTYYTVILDDITVSDMHFANIEADTKATTGKNFIPGENLEIQAVVYSNSVLANVAYSAKGTTNSIFGSISNAKDTAYIGNIRHLENLDKNISKLDENDVDDDKIIISKAEQTDSFSWTTFREKIREIEEATEGSTEKDPATVCVYPFDGSATKPGCYLPISPDYALSYDGKNHSISEVAVTDKDSANADLAHAGLFGMINEETVSEIKNLELLDFSIAGKTTAGALAGTIANPECTIANVLARNSTNAPGENISAPTAGGLIGEMSGKAEYSAAAVIVRGSIYAGGLIGRYYSGADKDTDTVEIEGCYSGGHTANGDYSAWVAAKDAHDVANGYDVTGGAAGGLIGNAGSATIKCSYSTCSVSGSSAAGGFAGEAQEGHIENCYATGLIDQTPATEKKYAFLGDDTPATPTTLSGNYYYSAVNRFTDADGETVSLPPVSGYALNETNLSKVKPLDLNTAAYNSFTGKYDDWSRARAYDAALVQYYGGRYNLRTVEKLGANVPDGSFVKTHYGDWPSPEVFFINT